MGNVCKNLRMDGLWKKGNVDAMQDGEQKYDIWLVKWPKADDTEPHSGLEFLCKTKSLKWLEQRCGMIT